MPEPKHTNSWLKFGRLRKSSVGRTQLVAWVEPKILEEIGDHLVKEEHEKLRPPRLHVPFEVYRVLFTVA